MLERDEILELVKKGLTEVGQELLRNSRFSNKDWTIGIISKLGGFALESGYTVYPELTEGGEVRKSSEWLYDLTWCIEDKERGWAFRGIGLALESEWKSDLWNLNYDFQKLVQAKTEVKVFVCNDLSDRNLECLVGNIKSFKPQNESERYLFALYQFNAEQPFAYRLYNGCGEEV